MTAPVTGLRAFVRGIFWSLWLPTVAAPHAIVLVFTLVRWPWRDAAAFVAFSAALTSFCLAVFVAVVGGLPFASPPRTSGNTAAFPITVAFFAVAAAVAALQNWLLFRQHRYVIVASAAFAAGAALVAPLSCRILERTVMFELERLTGGPQRLFQALADETVQT